MGKLNKAFALSTLMLTMLSAAPTDVGAQVSWQDNFEYNTGNLYGQGPWIKYGSNPYEPIQVVNQTLDYAGYPGDVKGKSVQLGNAASGEDLQARFDIHFGQVG